MTTTTNSEYEVWQIFRHTNGITLNPREYVLDAPEDEGGKPMEFPSRAEALEFCHDNGIEVSEDSGVYVAAFAEIECLECGERYWEEEDLPVDTCPGCGNKDKTRTVMLVPRHKCDDGLSL